MKAKVLTFFLTKDASTFNVENFERVKKQIGVIQSIYVVSAAPVPVGNNVVVPVPQHYPLPVRIGITINRALEEFDLSEYTHLFKVDSDVKLPRDYLSNLLSKNKPVAGRGVALLISTDFLRKQLSGKYPVSYCDDGYISALSIAEGVWPPEYNGTGLFKFPVQHQPLREYTYGYEYYKWGLPLPIFFLISPILLATRQRDVRSLVYNLAGYLSASINYEKKYPWWRRYSYHRTSHFVSKLFKFK
ncbi:MAG: hypothetical protein NZ954_01175 [Thermofilaceae archaeon]|nr:hypothetical protein [Thermofilaceae archaeon]MCX8180519.1 hypothetical protein [Thermofilaceae archaeon]MDW8003285.1 hypothetical protein [Thermofilaceae archaeon]